MMKPIIPGASVPPAPILFVGDLHLGRTPHRLKSEDVDPAELSPRVAWQRVVSAAIQHRVQAVVLAGDVVQADKDRFEAWGQLFTGAERLTQAGIQLIAVAGNHDSIALPKLTERLEQVTLLGAGGTWERLELDGFDIVGWSFPTNHHEADPTDSPDFTRVIANRRPGVTTLGVLHGDLDRASSQYAPVSRSVLAAQPVDAWLMGHIHKPSELQVPPHIGYLGSVVGLDRSETGPRGPWLLRLGAVISLEQLALGPLYWIELTVDLTNVNLSSDADDQLHTLITRQISLDGPADSWLKNGDFSHVGCTITFTGEVKNPHKIDAFIQSHTPGGLSIPTDSHLWRVVHFRDTTQLQVDLVVLAEEPTPAGRLAQLLLDLDANTALPPSLQTELNTFPVENWTVKGASLPEPNLRAKQAASSLLYELIEQRQQRGT